MDRTDIEREKEKQSTRAQTAFRSTDGRFSTPERALDTKRLACVIQKAEHLQTSTCSAESMAHLADARNEARALLEEASSQAQIDLKTDALHAQLLALRKHPQKAAIDHLSDPAESTVRSNARIFLMI